MFANARYIVIEGPIGSGKTSLTNRLAEEIEAVPMLEQSEHNPFLTRFYQHRERWALATQLSFLFQRIDQLGKIHAHLENSQLIVADFLIDKDPLFAAMNLEEDELALYQRTFQAVLPDTKRKPDLVIYLEAKPETLIKRIQQRGIEAEKRISESYLKLICQRYTSFFYDYDDAPVMIIDAEVLNPIESGNDFQLLLQRLQQMRSYREFFGYSR